MVASADPDSLVLRRRYKATPDVVYQLWTRPEFLAKWLRPSSDFRHQMIEVDARVGGKYRIAFESPEGRVDVVAGEYLEVTPGRRLSFSWMWEPPNEHAGIPSEVVVDFLDIDGETELVLTHRISDAEMRESHTMGWSGALDQIPDAIDDGRRSEGTDA